MIDNVSGQQPLTADQQAALAKLHTAAQQLEGLFVQMLFKEMRASAPETSITGKVSESEKTFREMLDQNRADALSKTGSLGIANIIEKQLRDSVLASVRTPSAAPAPPAAPAPGDAAEPPAAGEPEKRS